ncbi:MAG TPA: hypothetical protein DD733_04135 [Clostridiales bacterium]|nr:hypothetical protein [Clostridiales bacterium]
MEEITEKNSKVNEEIVFEKVDLVRLEKSAAATKKKKSVVLKVIRRVLITLLVLIVFSVYSVYTLCDAIVNGPSQSARDKAVLSAMQASATKWVPGLFLPDEEVDRIVSASEILNIDEINLDDYKKQTEKQKKDELETTDEWADYPDGIKYQTVIGATYRAYILLIKDPSKVYVATSSNFVNATAGIRLFNAVERENALAAIIGGEFNDTNGKGTGATPVGLTYSQGKMVWNDGCRRTFIGMDKDNKLIVTSSMTEEEANRLGIRDAVCFQSGNVLIDIKDDEVRFHYSDNNTGTAQRTAIGQRADGTVIFIVTDGRTGSSIGATRNDVIDMMVSCGAVTAGMLDGGSSAMMYYRDYITKYNIDTSTLDEYQKQGMVNKYKAFTNPRRIPTYWMVRGN